MAHVKNIFKAFLNGKWIPPVFVTPKGEVLDGQHRIAAFRMLKEKYPDSKAALPVMVVKEGALKISDEEYMEASKKAAALCLISVKLNTKVVFRRDVVVAFYRVWDKIPNIQTYVKRLSLFKMPLTESRKEWERAYEDLLR